MIIFITVVSLGIWIFFSHVKKGAKHAKYIKRAKRAYKKALAIEEPGRKINYLKSFNRDPFVFEEMVLLALKSKGYVIKRNKRYTGDGGIDGMAYFKDKTYYIQSKCYGVNQSIKTSDIEALKTICKRKNDVGLFVHTAKTPVTTMNRFRVGKIRIISGDRLIDLFT